MRQRDVQSRKLAVPNPNTLPRDSMRELPLETRMRATEPDQPTDLQLHERLAILILN